MDKNYLTVTEIKEMINTIKKNDLIPLEDMPEYDLLLSQVVDFFNVEHKISNDYDFTKNMIQNYIKYGLIITPKNGKKKAYSKEHLIYLSLIRNLKSIIKTNKIGEIFDPVFKDMSTSEDDLVPLEDIYKAFVGLSKDALDLYSNNIDIDFNSISKYLPKNLNENDEKNYAVFIAVIDLLVQSSARKRLAEALIDKYFS